MEVTLEKIELVKDRTGVSYKDAKDALEAADGSVVDAIINIEETIDSIKRSSAKEQGAAVVDAIKDLIKKGNVSKINVKSKDGETLVNVPVNVGIIGAVIAPWGMIAAIAATIGFKCVVEIVKDDGTIIDVSDRASDFAGKAREKGSEFADAAKSKATEMHGKVKDKASGAFDDAKDAAQGAFDSAVDKAAGAFDKTAEAVKSKLGKEDEEYSFE
ncbi:MAG: DUF4342 domain-containing protein [Anaerovoracaceae bacterium]|jgi:uncharacterized protein YjbJ (UPF0337 family)